MDMKFLLVVKKEKIQAVFATEADGHPVILKEDYLIYNPSEYQTGRTKAFLLKVRSEEAFKPLRQASCEMIIFAEKVEDLKKYFCEDANLSQDKNYECRGIIKHIIYLPESVFKEVRTESEEVVCYVFEMGNLKIKSEFPSSLGLDVVELKVI